MVGMMRNRGIKVQEQGWRKGPWTPEEDKLLFEYVTLYGEGRWSSVARFAGLNRTGKSCRLRWVNYLRPGLKRGQITPQEEGIIIELHALWGNKWSTIARYLPGRTDNEIKNFWRTHFKKKDKSSHKKQLLQKRRSFQVLKEKLRRDKEDNSKTTPSLIIASVPQMEIPIKPDQAKTTSICTDQETKLENFVDAALITNDGQTNNSEMYRDESTALLPWPSTEEDQEYGLYCGGFLWNLDDNMDYYGYCSRTEKLATQNNYNTDNINQAMVNAGQADNYYGSGDINYPNKVDNIPPINIPNGGYIF